MRLSPSSSRAAVMASTPPSFRTSSSRKPPRARAPPSLPPGPTAARASSPAQRHADTTSHIVAAACGSARDVRASASASPAGAAVMPQATGTATLPLMARTRPHNDSPVFNPRPRYGRRAPTVSESQLPRELGSICTRCMRSLSVPSNVIMCLRGFPCPWDVRPAAQPGWG